MINLKAVATLGIGFGFAAIAAIGFVDTVPVSTEVSTTVSSSGGGALTGGYGRVSSSFVGGYGLEKPKQTLIPVQNHDEADEEEIAMVIINLYYSGLI